MTRLFLSNQLDLLAQSLADELDRDDSSPLYPKTILLPNQKLKQWLMLALARLSQKQVVAGCRVFSIEKVLTAHAPSPIELFSAIFTWLQKSTDAELQNYLQGKKKRCLELTDHLSSLFLSYGKFGKDVLEQSDHWQHKMFQDLFVKGPWQLTPSLHLKGPIHCFAIDFLPESYWEVLVKASPLSIYLFSPCVHFWDDICTQWEKKKLIQKRSLAMRQELDSYLQEAPPLLANWGKLGRETLKIFDCFDFDIQDHYVEMQEGSVLQTIQSHIFHFERPNSKQPVDSQDRSIRIFQTGSSRWREVEILRENIEELANKGIPYSEIAVLAPNIDSYVPLIEFVFGETIPYRIQDVEVSSQSHFLQGLQKLLSLKEASFAKEAILTLFETPSFYQKFNWDLGKLSLIRGWIEQGIDQTLDGLLYVTELDVTWSSSDLLEEMIFILHSLEQDLKVEEKTWGEWALFLEQLSTKYLVPDEEGKSVLENLLNEFRSARVEGMFSLSVLRHLLARPSSGAIHSSSLHAVRFASLQPGAVLPARALFLIGMDEERFPRKAIPSSLDLLKKQKGFVPHVGDIDRYLMLQALFAAKEYLYFSYGHLSSEEGKPVAPSLALQELISDLEAHFECDKEQWFQNAPSLRTMPAQKGLGDFFGMDREFPELPQGEVTVALSDLAKLARHPWEFYLHKTLGIYIEKEPLVHFAGQRTVLARENIQGSFDEKRLPPGLIGLAQKQEVARVSYEWQKRLEEWNLKLGVWSMLASCREKKETSYFLEIPPLQIQVTDQLKVQIIGDLKTMSERGFVTTSDDLLKVWPEALVAALVSKNNELFLLKKGKVVPLSFPEESLRSFLIYYFRALSQASPLLPEWADFFLKNSKKDKCRFEDPVADWVLSRVHLPSEEELLKKWGWLKETFAYATV